MGLPSCSPEWCPVFGPRSAAPQSPPTPPSIVRCFSFNPPPPPPPPHTHAHSHVRTQTGLFSWPCSCFQCMHTYTGLYLKPLAAHARVLFSVWPFTFLTHSLTHHPLPECPAPPRVAATVKATSLLQILYLLLCVFVCVCLSMFLGVGVFPGSSTSQLGSNHY